MQYLEEWRLIQFSVTGTLTFFWTIFCGNFWTCCCCCHLLQVISSKRNKDYYLHNFKYPNLCCVCLSLSQLFMSLKFHFNGTSSTIPSTTTKPDPSPHALLLLLQQLQKRLFSTFYLLEASKVIEIWTHGAINTFFVAHNKMSFWVTPPKKMYKKNSKNK